MSEPRKKILYTDFEDSASIIANMLKSKDLQKAITRNNLYKFWEKVVGIKFAQKSRPYGMMGSGVMIIACQNSMVAQELMMQKTQLIEKFKPYLKSLRITIKDFKFDPKKWEE